MLQFNYYFNPKSKNPSGLQISKSPSPSPSSILAQLQKEEEKSIKNATLQILQDPKFSGLSADSKARKISEIVMTLQEQFASVKLLIMRNHDPNFAFDF